MSLWTATMASLKAILGATELQWISPLTLTLSHPSLVARLHSPLCDGIGQGIEPVEGTICWMRDCAHGDTTDFWVVG